MLRLTLKPWSAVFACVGAALVSQPAIAQSSDAGDETLAAATLSEGESARAVAMLKAALEEYPGDPAILINLGIAHAHSGNDPEARKSFQAALSNRNVTELETADGRQTDSRRLARLALAMLERGEFRPSSRPSQQFTLRE